MTGSPTLGQERLLLRVAALASAGRPAVFNYRAATQIERLEALGLVTADWDADLDSQKGRLRWRITVTLTDEGKKYNASVKGKS